MDIDLDFDAAYSGAFEYMEDLGWYWHPSDTAEVRLFATYGRERPTPTSSTVGSRLLARHWPGAGAQQGTIPLDPLITSAMRSFDPRQQVVDFYGARRRCPGRLTRPFWSISISTTGTICGR